VIPALFGCAEDAASPYTPLSAREALIRLSVELRGIHPRPAELEAIEGQPQLYESFVDAWLDDERAGGRIREVWNERWRIRNGVSYFNPEEAGIVTAEPEAVADAIAEEPLRIVSWTFEEDRSYADVVLADTTQADPLVAAMWGLDYPQGAEGWQALPWTDGRPAAGVLSSTTMWQRFPSAGDNANRHRANAIARLFLCDDYLEQPIELTLEDIEALAEDPEGAILANPACQACHVTLDPMAANLFGFFHVTGDQSLQTRRTYHPENERLWQDYANKSPAWFGRPTSGLREMAEALAGDPRFAACAVRTAVEGFGQRTVTEDDWHEFESLVEDFRANDLRLRPLLRSIVTSEAFLAARVEDPALAERVPSVRTASPEQLAAIVEDITGYRMVLQGRDLLTAQTWGGPVIAGGVDGRFVDRRIYQPTDSLAVIQERLAQAAAAWVVDQELGGRVAPDLFDHVTIEDTPTSAPGAFDDQMRSLYERVTGMKLENDSEVPAALVAVWSDVFAMEGSPEKAWRGVLSALLRDPRVLFY
jgi:hypothetical protein